MQSISLSDQSDKQLIYIKKYELQVGSTRITQKGNIQTIQHNYNSMPSNVSSATPKTTQTTHVGELKEQFALPTVTD